MNEVLTQKEINERIERISMKTPDQLKAWLIQARPFVIFEAADLAGSMRWPDGVQSLQSVVDDYHQHRLKLPTGDHEEQIEPMTGQRLEVPIMKDQRLTAEEMDRCIRWLIGQLTDLRPSWTIEDAPL